MFRSTPHEIALGNAKGIRNVFLDVLLPLNNADFMNDSPGTEGYVAFFDILGYREMTHAGDFGRVIKILKEAKCHVQRVKHKLQNCEVRMFADSVLVFCFGETPDLTEEAALLEFAAYSRYLFESMFKSGMPMRGAIAKGKFYSDSDFFAGRPINEAYEYSNSLDFAGCVLAPSAENLCVGHQFDTEDYMFALLDVPLKTQGKQKMFVLKHCLAIDRCSIREAFEAHGKTIGPSVMSKFNNTVAILGATKQSRMPS